MISKYEDNLEIKKEIENYFSILNSIVSFEKEEKVKSSIKKILFLKKFMENFDTDNRHYKRYAVYDLLMIMHSTTQNSIRNYYNYYRSFIENYMRVTLKLSDDDETGVFSIFRHFKKLSNNEECNKIVQYLDDEYSKACNYVHSNIKANINLYEYYKDILSSDEIGKNQRQNMIEEVNILLGNCVKFIVIVYANELDGVFFRRKQELEFFIGNECYSRFKESIE